MDIVYMRVADKRTKLLIRAWTSAHDGHRVATAILGETKPLSRSAFGQVLHSAFDLCKLLAGVHAGSRLCLASCLDHESRFDGDIAADESNLPSNWEAKAFASSRLTVELAPVSRYHLFV